LWYADYCFDTYNTLYTFHHGVEWMKRGKEGEREGENGMALDQKKKKKIRAFFKLRGSPALESNRSLCKNLKRGYVCMKPQERCQGNLRVSILCVCHLVCGLGRKTAVPLTSGI
jgi:hypothetical protein